MSVRKKIALLGSTGSIGTYALRVVRHLSERFEIAAIAAKTNIDLLYTQVLEFCPQIVSVFDPIQALVLQKRLPEVTVLAGMEGLCAAASLEEVDFVLVAIPGSIALLPTVAAIEKGKRIGLANKEALVCGGAWLCNLARKRGSLLMPVDSEQCALHRCLQGREKQEVRRLVLTASGGAFREKSLQALQEVTVQEATVHPHWRAGPKTAVDCTTLMNKGLEMIAAHFLFEIEPDRIEAVIHPQSRIHSCVEFIDGTLLALMAESDMVWPVQYALTYPDLLPGMLPAYDFFKNGTLHFSTPDRGRFPCLQLSQDALKAGKSYPCFLSAANEVLVERFLAGEIPWTAIGERLDKLIASHQPENMVALEAILSVDRSARELAARA
ncbi:MAG: 1-deoxy-D-xylulose-5-phosphate reductoisomerase [Chlamydiia bacterium]|nr:1-deoxy-D-xylulose-5-phosphate reductoisomerase [Chlamydiia bacterium]